MQQLQDYFQNRLPRIEACLEAQVKTMNSMVYPVASHILQAGGKRLRPMLCLLTARTLDSCLEEEGLYPLACALELVHSATLLHDDVLDNAEMRRGRDAAHLRFGVTETILAGDALLALANQIVTSYQSVPLVSCISQAIYETASGEILEIQKMKQPSLSCGEYLEIVRGKTGCLIQTACQSGAIMGRAQDSMKKAAGDFGLNLGIAFQLVDDALDYAASSSHLGKPLGGDLREGKLTLPLIYFLQEMEAGKRQELLLKIKDRRLSSQEHTWIVEQIQDRRLGHRTREVAGSYLSSARRALSALPPGEEHSLLHQMLEFIQSRQH